MILLRACFAATEMHVFTETSEVAKILLFAVGIVKRKKGKQKFCARSESPRGPPPEGTVRSIAIRHRFVAQNWSLRASWMERGPPIW